MTGSSSPHDRTILQTLLRPIAAWLLAAAMASGDFVLPVGALLPEGLVWLAAPKYLLVAIPFMISIATESARGSHRDQIEVRALLALWMVYAVYAIFRTVWTAPTMLAWGAIEPPLLVTASMITAYRIIDCRRQAWHFGVAFLTMLAGAASAFLTFSTSGVPFHTFYASRMFFIGGILTLSIAIGAPLRSMGFAVGALLSVLLFYTGLASMMRAALLFYAVALAVTLVLLAAVRAWRAALVVVLICTCAYSAHLVVHAVPISDKLNAYSPVRDDTYVDAVGSLHESRCRARIDAEFKASPIRSGEEFACRNAFTVFDVDGRIRLILTALKTNPSLLLGSGLGTYRFVDAARPRSPVVAYAYPHNIVAEVYHATGLIGLAVVGASLLLVCALTIRFSMTHPQIAVLSAIPIFALLAGFVAGNIYDARFLWLMPIIASVWIMPVQWRHGSSAAAGAPPRP